MKKGLPFIGIVITSMVMLFASNEVKSSPGHSSSGKCVIEHSPSLYRIAEAGLPLNPPPEESAPFYKAVTSLNALSICYIPLPQQGFYFYRSLFETQNIEKWKIHEPFALPNLLMILCRDTISPNAP
jgi:hypothetical protein